MLTVCTLYMLCLSTQVSTLYMLTVCTLYMLINGFHIEFSRSKEKNKRDIFSDFFRCHFSLILTWVSFCQLCDVVEEHYICFVAVNGKAKLFVVRFHVFACQRNELN